jgi:hypothetical protein
MQPMSFVPFDSDLADYADQAEALLVAFAAGEKEAAELVHRRHPRFLDERIKWLPKRMSEDEVRASPFDMDDARLTVARTYDFADWQSLANHVDAVTARGSPTAQFEAAVEAVIGGDVGLLVEELRSNPGLARARSTRVTCFDPAVHRATLLHYLAANGVEGYRQKSPSNAVEVATTLLEAGADPNALAGMYGGESATMPMLVSSTPPAEAGVQIGLIDTLVDYGAAIEPRGMGTWTSPLMTALAFGFTEAARALVRHGASADTVAASAGLGDRDAVARLLPEAAPVERQRALSLAAQPAHADIVALLLDAGEDPDRYNPEGNHPHSTPLHQAVWMDNDDVVRLLVERGARLDIRDTIYQATPLGWASHGGKAVIADYLRAHGG